MALCTPSEGSLRSVFTKSERSQHVRIYTVTPEESTPPKIVLHGGGVQSLDQRTGSTFWENVLVFYTDWL